MQFAGSREGAIDETPDNPGSDRLAIFRTHGQHWRRSRVGQLKVMSAIEQCRSAALGGHMLQCSACEHTQQVCRCRSG